jgi:hypothetical protein
MKLKLRHVRTSQVPIASESPSVVPSCVGDIKAYVFAVRVVGEGGMVEPSLEKAVACRCL